MSTDAAGDAPPNPRVLALDLLTQVLRRRRPLDEALEAQSAVARPDLARLAARDRGFIRLVVATCLRRLGQIDALIDACLAKPLPAKAAPVRDVLRLGIAQLVFLGTAAHAAVNSTVELAEAAGFAGHKGLVNAMMRRLVREGPARIAAQDAAILNTPDWLWRSWTSAYGEATGRAIAAAHLAEPPLDLTVKSGAEAWAARLGARILPTGTLRLVNAGSVADLAGYGEGGWWVQDAAAALPARLLGDVRGQRVIDLCAAPGGKTAQLAAAGAIVTAVDRTQKRLVRLSANLDRLGLAAELVAADAALWRPPAPADAVLLDAPCSATGTIRRHPDLPWLKTAEDVTKLAAVQDRLLAAAIAMVRPGGSVVFCTCSLEPMEGPERIGALLASDAPVALDPIQAGEIELPEAITQEGFLRTLPCQWGEIGGMDGFFAARVRRAG